jgi:hypothetical protein
MMSLMQTTFYAAARRGEFQFSDFFKCLRDGDDRRGPDRPS